MLLARRLEFHLILDSCSSGHRLHISELPWKEAEQAEDFLPVNLPEKGGGGCEAGRRECPAWAFSGEKEAGLRGACLLWEMQSP